MAPKKKPGMKFPDPPCRPSPPKMPGKPKPPDNFSGTLKNDRLGKLIDRLRKS